MLGLFQKIPSITVGTAAICPYDRRWGCQYLWLGGADGEPLLWRVLSKEGNQAGYRDSGGEDFSGEPLFLLSEYLLGTHLLTGKIQRDFYVYFNRTPDPCWDLDRPASVWQASDGRRWCGDFAQSCFEPAEGAAVLATFKSDREYRPRRDAYDPALPPFPAAPDILKGDRVFFLSAEEAEREDYGFPHKRSYTAESEWWTRTYEGRVGYGSSPSPEVSIVLTHFGGLLCAPASRNMKFFARPALNLDTSRVVFASLEGAKPRALPGETAVLAPVSSVGRRKGLTWKLTLRDESRERFFLGQVRQEGDALVIPYGNAAVYDPSKSPNERVSALVTDSEGTALKYYGNIALPLSAEGEARVVLPRWERGDRLFVLCEQCNGEGKTDYASPMVEAELP